MAIVPKSFGTKQSMAGATLLVYFEPRKLLAIVTDSSNVKVGAALEQKHGDRWLPFAYYQRELSKAECKYSPFDRKLLASSISNICWKDLSS